MVKGILSPALGRPAELLKDALLFGSVEECTQKINAFYEAGVKRIHFWPINDFEEQIKIFKKDIACNYEIKKKQINIRFKDNIQFATHKV